MARTEVRTHQIKDQTVNRDDLDITTTSKAVISKVIAGTAISISSTGVDAGTGDVTINSTEPTSVLAIDDTTTDATVTTLATITPSTSGVVAFEINLAARFDDTGSNKSYWCKISGGVRRNNSGSAALVGTPLIVDDAEGSALYNATVDVSGNTLRVRVQGEASEDVNWKGEIRYREAT